MDHVQLIEAIKRLGAPEKLIRVLRAFYKHPQFKVRDREGDSSYRPQKTGIRQGCPLSPYLFVMLMTVLMRDVQVLTEEELRGGEGAPFELWNLLYADDTLLMGRNGEDISKILQEIERQSKNSKYIY